MAVNEQRGYRSGGDSRRRDERRSEERKEDDLRDEDHTRRYRAPTCFNCHEPGHYVNQCPEKNRRRYYSERPSTSYDSRGGRSPRRRDYRHDNSPGKEVISSTVAELGKSVAAMKDFYEEARLEEAKERRRTEKIEAEEREAAEREKAERKAKKKMDKMRREAEVKAERRAELRKDNDIHLVIRLSEMEDNFSAKMKCVTEPLKELLKKGKRKVTYASASDTTSEEASDTSVTQELSEQAGRLFISEKRKRGPEQVVGDSPPMELTPKRTPRKGALKPTKLTGRLTRVKKMVKSPRSAKRKAPVKTPLSTRLKTVIRAKTPVQAVTPAKKGALQRLRFRDVVLSDLKTFDATELQRICKEEGVPYDGKIDAIFAIAYRRVCERYGPDHLEITDVIEVIDSEAGQPSEDQSGKKSRLGRKERNKSRKERQGNVVDCKIIRDRRSVDEPWVVDFYHLFDNGVSDGLLNPRVIIEGGKVWHTGWKKFVRAFGETKLRKDGQIMRLRDSKRILEEGGEFENMGKDYSFDGRCAVVDCGTRYREKG
ncbi:hypothetical protein CBR_g55375 [Chara braunii]|uniref:CCHC-type domain-containing protein n=1 Tax=Chara braunii TaxID=69332 RepID=A0A388MCZ8_CHABU|nr:hypothetical protein CBR_g55375 [Chara braunii]|eukprot:GBG92438.1 hypothetical protein CBR_g55375 [Chara braunii]